MNRLRSRQYLLVFIGLFVSCTEIFVTNIEAEKIDLLAPGDSLLTKNKDQVFYWNELDDAEFYEFQIVSPSFDSISEFFYNESLEFNTVEMMLDTGKFQWRVRAGNGEYYTRFSTRSLEIKDSSFVQ